MASLSGELGGIGQGVSDLFGAIGQFEEAGAYNTAASYATQNAEISKESTAIQQTQLSRQLYQVQGAEQADVAGGGFKQSGSAIDVFRSNAQQGSLAHQLLGRQGIINENSYLAAAAQYKAMAQASNSAGIGGILGGIFSAVSAFV